MAETALEQRPRIFDRATPRDLDARVFTAGVAAVTVSTLTFLLVQLNGWMSRNSRALLMWLLLAAGAYLVVRGVVRVSGL